MTLYYKKKPTSEDKTYLPLDVITQFLKGLKRIYRVKQDLGFSKKGKTIALYAVKRLVHVRFENNRDMRQFLHMMAHVYHKRDNMPLYIEKNAVYFS